MASMQVRRHASIANIPESAWRGVEPTDFPFAAHGFFLSLETGGCLGPARGWVPVYLTAWRATELVGAMALFHRGDSYGEFIFDFAWADAYRRHGWDYYPKLTVAIPFTPANGPKFLVRPGEDADAVREALLREAELCAAEARDSGVHFLFTTADEAAFLAARGYIDRRTFQFQWHNHAYPDFTAFLAALKPKRRKEILRERRDVAAQGFAIRRLARHELTPEAADLMHGLYATTVARKGGAPYLTRAFFRDVFARLPDDIVMETAQLGGDVVAATFNMARGGVLYGRYWGAAGEYRNLHFEMCYYRLVESAIAHGWHRVEAGAQGTHKLARGFVPTLTYSSHKLFHPAFHRAIAEAVAAENAGLEEGLADESRFTPFREASDDHSA